MVTIQLDSSVASLRLTTSDAPWCEVSLVTGSGVIFLGGDSPGKVRDGLLRFVGEEFRQASAGVIDLRLSHDLGVPLYLGTPGGQWLLITPSGT